MRPGERQGIVGNAVQGIEASIASSVPRNMTVLVGYGEAIQVAGLIEPAAVGIIVLT